VKVEKIFNV